MKTWTWARAPCRCVVPCGSIKFTPLKPQAADAPSSFPAWLRRPSQGTVRRAAILLRVGYSPRRLATLRPHESFWRWGWKPTLRKADLPESLTFHQLRHGAASLLLNQNVPVPVVSRYLGHVNPSITMKVYAHLLEGTSGIAATGMDEALGESS